MIQLIMVEHEGIAYGARLGDVATLAAQTSPDAIAEVDTGFLAEPMVRAAAVLAGADRQIVPLNRAVAWLVERRLPRAVALQLIANAEHCERNA